MSDDAPSLLYAPWRRFVSVVAIALVAAWLMVGLGQKPTRLHDGLTYAAGELAHDLDRPHAESRPGKSTRIVLDVRDADGAPCRAFVRADISGVACRDEEGWHLRVQRDGIDFDDPARVAAIEREVRTAAQALAAREDGQ
jgi:hypothetical protein